LLAGGGRIAVASAVGQMLAAVAHAQDAAPAAAPAGPGLCMTMLFMQGQKARFDSAAYAKKHLPLLRQVYGDSVERFEMRTANASAQGMPSSILASATMWIRDVPGFSQKLGANAEQINKDLDSVSKGNRLVQVDRIVLQMGEARDSVPDNSNVFSLFYAASGGGMGGFGMGGPGMGGPGMGGPGMGGPGRGGGRGAPGGAPGGAAAGSSGGTPAAPKFDPAFFVDVYLPKLYSLYGSDAVRRLEATLGVDQGGQKATHIGAYHLSIRDRKDYDRKQGSVFTELQKDSGQFTTIFPLFADMRVSAVA
jgi:hypothetical protein